MARELTEKQKKFLTVLFDEAGGDVVLAKKVIWVLRSVLAQQK